jgi:DNA replication protein DnaC
MILAPCLDTIFPSQGIGKNHRAIAHRVTTTGVGIASEFYEKVSIIITSNKSFDNWAEMLGDKVMTTALLDRLLHHAKIFNLYGVSYRIKDKQKIKKEVK